MATTIQVGDDVLAMLKQMRQDQRVGSYNAVIKSMITRQRPDSIAGLLGRNHLSKEEVRQLRDKDD